MGSNPIRGAKNLKGGWLVPRSHRSGWRRATNVLYHNCAVYPPDSDEVMFRCDKERMEWYLEKGLAVLIKEAPPAMRLTFKPKGPGHAGNDYFLQEFKNRCVVCGTEDKLSHHHILPYCYRRYFPKDSYEFGRWMYDVLLLCLDCHEKYEKVASGFKKELADEHGVPVSGISNVTSEMMRAMSSAAALYRHGDKIPQDRREKLEATVKAYLGKDVLSKEDLAIWKSFRNTIEVTTAGKIIVERLNGGVDDFAIRWRRHFIKFMKPKFLPEGWDPERRIYSEVEPKAPSSTG